MTERSIHPDREMGPLEATHSGLLAGGIIRALRGYQFLSRRLWPRQCRFHPTCSQYAIEAFSKHGFGRGARLTAGRLCRCHPWHPGGLDPVP